MFAVAELLYSRRLPQVAALALISSGLAGCSGDMSTRLSQTSLPNPFASQESTGSVPPAPVQRELPQYSRPQSTYQSQALPPPPVAAPQSYPVSGGTHGASSYTPPPKPQLETTGTVPRSVAAARP